MGRGAGLLAALRPDRVGRGLRHRSLHAQHRGPGGRHARVLDRARRARRPHRAAAGGHHRERQHLPASRPPRQDGGQRRHHLGRPPHLRPGRGLAGERAPRLRDGLLHHPRAARAAGRGVPGAEGALDRGAGQLQGPLLSPRRRAADAQAGAEAAPRADDRRRGREGHAAHRGPARRSLERVGRAGAIPSRSCAPRSWCWASPTTGPEWSASSSRT